jgi:hypothetical protein
MRRPLGIQREVFPGLLDNYSFDALATEYRQQTGYYLSAVDTAGRFLRGRSGTPSCTDDAQASRQQALLEVQRWGEPSVMCCACCGRALWAVPVIQNQRLCGGLLARIFHQKSIEVDRNVR